jgi:hypothetical protein
MWFKRSSVIEVEEKKLRDIYTKLSSPKLRSLQGSRSPGDLDHGMATQILEERDSWRRFWMGNAVAWFSLIVAMMSAAIAGLALYVAWKKIH